MSLDEQSVLWIVPTLYDKKRFFIVTLILFHLWLYILKFLNRTSYLEKMLKYNFPNFFYLSK